MPVADGDPHLGFVDMTVRMGQGRDADATASPVLYAAAEAAKIALDDRPFALSLEVMEIESRFAEKRFNTLHAHLLARMMAMAETPQYDQSLTIALLRARDAVTALFREHVAAAGLTLQQWRVIRALAGGMS